MKKPTLSFWNVRLPWIDMLVCFIISVLAMPGFAAVSPLGRKLLANPGFNFADFLVYLLIGYGAHFVLTLAFTLLLAMLGSTSEGAEPGAGRARGRRKISNFSPQLGSNSCGLKSMVLWDLPWKAPNLGGSPREFPQNQKYAFTCGEW
jgi:hypothetical protein